MSVTEARAEVRELTYEQYAEAEGHYRASEQRMFEDSPPRYRDTLITGRMKPEKDSDALRLGSAKHMAILERERFATEAVVIPAEVLDKAGKRSGNKWKEWEAENSGRTILSAKEYDQVQWCAETVWESPKVAAFLRNCAAFEQSLFWTAGGLKKKARLDGVNPLDSILLDIKNTRFEPVEFWRSVKKFGYHATAAHYCEGFESFFGSWPEFYFLLIGSRPPFEPCIRGPLQIDALEEGRRMNDKTLAEIEECKAGLRPWCKPGFDEVLPLNLPPLFYQDAQEPNSEMV